MVPVLSSVILSFQHKFTHHFPTLENYLTILRHFQFREALFNTLVITIFSLTLELTAAMGLALLLSKRFIGRGLVRALVIIPLGVPTIVAASNMRYFFDTHGYFNELLYRLHLITTPIDWTQGGLGTLLVIAVSDMWKVTPLVMLVLLAGLENIPRELYDAAKVDGASSWQTFRRITLPLLKPFITMALIIRGIDAFRLFELPLTLVGSRVPVISTYTYFEYFQFNNPYTSAAASVVLLIIILVSVVWYVRTVSRTECDY